MRNLMRKLFLLAPLLLLMACGGKEFESKSVQMHNFVVSGDPMALVAGTQMNRQNYLTESELQNVYLNGLMLFKEKQPDSFIESADIAPNSIYSSRAYDSAYGKTVRHTKQGTKFVLGSMSAQQGPIEMVLRQVGSQYRLDGILLAGQKQAVPVEMLHISHKKNNRAFSLLFYGNFSLEGTVLFALNFEKKGIETQSSFMERALHDLFLFFSPDDHLAMKWSDQQTVTLNLCGVNQLAGQRAVLAYVKWKEAIGSNLDFKVDVLESYPPFSDLNTSCLYQVDSYAKEPLNQEQAIAGSATAFAYQDSGEIFDGDIFIWNQEIRKIAPDTPLDHEVFTGLYDFVMVHEMGHFLGLAHQWFRPSVMSYDGHSNLQDYDRNAVQYLYGF
jgi:hypothetical protein